MLDFLFGEKVVKITTIREKKVQVSKKMYSEEEVINALHSIELKDNKDYSKIYKNMKKWFEQFKKK